jgi:3-dehydroquinate synthase
MLDSSVGGKTGVDTSLGKNLIGAFHQPRAVLADVSTLRSLPRQHVAAGMAEAIKHGAIADALYFSSLSTVRERILARDPAALQEVISRGVAIKADVVARDERESGQRAILNFGHTIGHAIELTSGYGILHGEAVAIGMVLESALGVALGVTRPEAAAHLRDTISSFGLPHQLPATFSAPRLLDAMLRDKKVRSGSVRFALIEDIGSIARPGGDSWTIPVGEQEILTALSG